MPAVLAPLRATGMPCDLERRDLLVVRRIAWLVEGLPIAEVAQGELELHGYWLDAQVSWRGLWLGHMALAAIEREMDGRGVAR